MGGYSRPKLLTATESNEKRGFTDPQTSKYEKARLSEPSGQTRTERPEAKNKSNRLAWTTQRAGLCSSSRARLVEPGEARRAGPSSWAQPGSLSSARLVGISSAHPADFRRLGSWASRTSFYGTLHASASESSNSSNLRIILFVELKATNDSRNNE